MIVTPELLEALYLSFKFTYAEALKNAPVNWSKIAYRQPSETAENAYPWMGQFQPMREWLGDRVVGSLEKHGFAIKNRKFESTVSIPCTEIEDDRFGMYKGAFSNIGRMTAQHPDLLCFGLLKQGFSTLCYDHQNFFDEDHLVHDENDREISVSNMQAGTGEPWFLLDTTQAVKPLVWQVRVDYEFQQLAGAQSDEAFFKDAYHYGVRARVNAGFALWQLAFGSRATLNAANYAAARAAMSKLRGDRGQILGVSPSLLVVGPDNEEKARTLLKATSINASAWSREIPDKPTRSRQIALTPGKYCCPLQIGKTGTRGGDCMRVDRLAILFGITWLAIPVDAAVVDSPQCRADLARAHGLIREIRNRENSVAPGDSAGLCALLRKNQTAMSEAGRLMDRCMTGHERGENVGQIMASLGDINMVLRRRCQ